MLNLSKMKTKIEGGHIIHDHPDICRTWYRQGWCWAHISRDVDNMQETCMQALCDNITLQAQTDGRIQQGSEGKALVNWCSHVDTHELTLYQLWAIASWWLKCLQGMMLLQLWLFVAERLLGETLGHRCWCKVELFQGTNGIYPPCTWNHTHVQACSIHNQCWENWTLVYIHFLDTSRGTYI